MRTIKKNIIIILSSAVIAAVIGFAINTLQAGLSSEDLSRGPTEAAGSSAATDIQDTDPIKNEKQQGPESENDEDLAAIEQDIIIEAPPEIEKDSENEQRPSPETIEEGSDDGEDVEIQEEIEDLENETPTETGDNDDIEAMADENIEDEQPFSNRDDIDYSDSENFRIEIDLARQRVIVFYKEEMLREMICSGGALETPTPLGEFVTSQKIEYSFVARFDVGAYYWTRFFEDYLIHSVPFDEDGEMIIEEYEKLGSPASHGCIRLRLDEAKWLYETIPLGVKVLIYQ